MEKPGPPPATALDPTPQTPPQGLEQVDAGLMAEKPPRTGKGRGGPNSAPRLLASPSPGPGGPPLPLPPRRLAGGWTPAPPPKKTRPGPGGRQSGHPRPGTASPYAPLQETLAQGPGPHPRPPRRTSWWTASPPGPHGVLAGAETRGWFSTWCPGPGTCGSSSRSSTTGPTPMRRSRLPTPALPTGPSGKWTSPPTCLTPRPSRTCSK